jgi:hypothetical protein
VRRGALQDYSDPGIGWNIIAGIAKSSPAVRSAFWSGYRDGFKLRGTVKSYSKPADSGRPIVRRFCPECGSSIGEEPGSDLVVLNGGTLDDLNSLTLAMQIYCEREYPGCGWIEPNLVLATTVTSVFKFRKQVAPICAER